MNKIVNYELEINNQTKFTNEQKKEIKAISEMNDNEIDYSDIPPLDDEFWQQAVRNPFYKPKKTATTVRVDNDVLLWLKAQGKGYQTRINSILREAMIRSIHHEN